MKAICLGCYLVIEFRNQRGNKLADHKCKCGGSFRRMIYEEYDPYGGDIYKVNQKGLIYRFRQFQGVWINTEIRLE